MGEGRRENGVCKEVGECKDGEGKGGRGRREVSGKSYFHCS